MYLMTSFATKIAFKVGDIGDVVYSAKWYNYPLPLRVHVQLLIQSTQRTRYLTGLRIVYCNLETFLKVNNDFGQKYIF